MASNLIPLSIPSSRISFRLPMGVAFFLSHTATTHSHVLLLMLPQAMPDVEDAAMHEEESREERAKRESLEGFVGELVGWAGGRVGGWGWVAPRAGSVGTDALAQTRAEASG